MQILLNTFLIYFIKYFYLFFLGSSLGSFYKTLLDRIFLFFYSPLRKTLNEKQKYYKLFFTPSFCYHCGNRIKLIHLIPILGFFLTKRKCFYCKKKLEIELFLWEAFGGILLIFFYYHYDVIGIFFVLVIFHYLITAIIDYKKFFIDYENITFIYLLNSILVFLLKEDIKLILFRVFIFVGIFLCLFYLGKKKKLGFADVILIGAISIFFSYVEIILILNFSSLASVGFILLYKKNKKSPAPLGCFLSLFSIIFLILQPFKDLFVNL